MSKDVIDFDQAERNARLRDIERDKVLNDDEMQIANELQQKADDRGMILIPKRKHNSKIKFVQIFQENWTFLEEKGYLKTEEVVFLMKLVPYIGFGSNGIVDSPKKKQPLPLNQTGIAEALKTSKTKVSRVVNNLVDKGILSRAESGSEGNSKAYALFVNPNIIFCGDRENLEEGLKLLFTKPMKMAVLKQLPIKLFEVSISKGSTKKGNKGTKKK
ncbi:helix-turn-helix domain-containing protein [Bacillus cereus group sp. BfR-BA-01326]|uniref:MarR family transcriptional regulator n=1 Tax=Bacillus cereus group sp. BfR-BA-01326 TaxID=2920302 RepID=UPI001F56B363|nr:helix-turn-helix domain-containing protein [Bacillus cereus group sp. BfR-BA-01326]